MVKVEQAPDLNGRDILRGDTVTTVTGDLTGKVKDIAKDDGELFVEVRPVYRAAGKGVWHAADRLLWLSRPNSSKANNSDSNGSKSTKTALFSQKAPSRVKMKK